MDTIYVLGAGASIGAKRIPEDHLSSLLIMPSANNFFADVFYQSESERSSEQFINFLGMTYEGVNDLLVRAWGMARNIDAFDIRDWQNINVEDVLTFLDVGERMFTKGTDYYKAFQESRMCLEDFIVHMILLRCLGQRCEYLEKVFKKLNPTDTIISFNWDTLADATLDYLGNDQFKNYLKVMSEDSIRISKYKTVGLLLKLHGSVNWVFCENGNCPDYGRIRLPVLKKRHPLLNLSLDSFAKCKTCKHPAKVFIVPPVSNKAIIHRNSFLHKLWLIARGKLPRASRLVFIGYSFPSTDFYTGWLFRQIYFLAEGRPEITVVNPEVKKRNSEVLRRYKAIFRGHEFETFDTLREYAEYVEKCT